MNKEREIWTEITAEEYESYLELLTLKLGDPKKQVRLSLQATDASRTDLDTRIRITNGKAVLMQKIGDWKAETRNELEIEIESTVESVFNNYKVLRNMLNGDNLQTSLMQMESYTFENESSEIKLTKQTGSDVAYNYEIEVFDNTDPIDIAKSYSMRIEIPEHTSDFWNAWNERVNIDIDELTDKELKEIIRKYL